MRLIDVGAAELEVYDAGAGEPVVLIQTALNADELVPLADHIRDRGSYRVVAYQRRGYAGSTPVRGPGSVVRDAADCRDLIATLGLGAAHVVGYSYSGAVGMQLAVDAPERVHTLTLVEPPPVHVPSADEFRAANQRLQETRRERGPVAALEEFLTTVIGPDWRRDVDDKVPGAAAHMERDTATFFDTDLPALLSWQFDAELAGRIGCPVLHVGGSDSGVWFAEVREQVLTWLPHAEDVTIEGADHSLTLTHTSLLADAMTSFFARHPKQIGDGT